MRKMFIAILVCMLIGGFAGCSGKANVTENADFVNAEIAEIPFPAYRIKETDSAADGEIAEMISGTPKFRVSFPLPENWDWELTKNVGISVPTGEFYTPVYLYADGKLIGYIGFCPFLSDVPEDTPAAGAYPVILPNLRLSSMFQWDPYTVVKTTDNGEVGVVEISYTNPDDIADHPGELPGEEVLTTSGIVAYDMKLRVSVGIAFMPDTISAEQAAEIAKRIEITPEEG